MEFHQTFSTVNTNMDQSVDAIGGGGGGMDESTVILVVDANLDAASARAVGQLLQEELLSTATKKQQQQTTSCYMLDWLSLIKWSTWTRGQAACQSRHWRR